MKEFPSEEIPRLHQPQAPLEGNILKMDNLVKISRNVMCIILIGVYKTNITYSATALRLTTIYQYCYGGNIHFYISKVRWVFKYWRCCGTYWCILKWDSKHIYSKLSCRHAVFIGENNIWFIKWEYKYTCSSNMAVARIGQIQSRCIAILTFWLWYEA